MKNGILGASISIDVDTVVTCILCDSTIMITFQQTNLMSNKMSSAYVFRITTCNMCMNKIKRANAYTKKNIYADDEGRICIPTYDESFWDVPDDDLDADLPMTVKLDAGFNTPIGVNTITNMASYRRMSRHLNGYLRVYGLGGVCVIERLRMIHPNDDLNYEIKTMVPRTWSDMTMAGDGSGITITNDKMIAYEYEDGSFFMPMYEH